jgi:hypothetical protein
MKKIIFLFLLTGLVITVRAQVTAGNTEFPEAFKLKPAEYPKNFDLTPIDERAKREGVTNNPGLIDVAKFASAMYEGANAAAINQILITGFSDKDPEGMDINVFAIQFKSAKDLEKESSKFSAKQALKIFLKRDKYLVIVSGDLEGSYKERVNKIADQLSQRLGLERIILAEEKEEPMEEPVAVPAQ